MANMELKMIGNIIVLLIVAFFMFLAIRYLVRHRTSGCTGCSGECGCSHCAVAEKMVENINKASESGK